MFTIKTYVNKSEIEGLGVFASEFIAKGEIIWIFQPNLDLYISEKKYRELPELAQQFYKHYGYRDKKYYTLCGDNARYTNHSLDPNMEQFDAYSSKTTRDIYPGEEITENYFVFDSEASLKLS